MSSHGGECLPCLPVMGDRPPVINRLFFPLTLEKIGLMLSPLSRVNRLGKCGHRRPADTHE